MIQLLVALAVVCVSSVALSHYSAVLLTLIIMLALWMPLVYKQLAGRADLLRVNAVGGYTKSIIYEPLE